MNHSYHIVTNEVDQTTAGRRFFVAQLANVYVEIGGKRVVAPYPNVICGGATYAQAMLKANDVFKTWLANFERGQHNVEF